MVFASYRDILTAAQRMPLDDRAELVASLLPDIGSWLRAKSSGRSASDLAPLSGLSATELRVLAGAVVAPGHQRSLHTLLDKKRSGILAQDEEQELDELLAQADQVALLKARARYTLKVLGEAAESRG